MLPLIDGVLSDKSLNLSDFSFNMLRVEIIIELTLYDFCEAFKS